MQMDFEWKPSRLNCLSYITRLMIVINVTVLCFSSAAAFRQVENDSICARLSLMQGRRLPLSRSQLVHVFEEE